MPSPRHGRRKRYRVRYKDANGNSGERLFALKRDAEARDAEARDAEVRAGVASASKVDRARQRLTFRDYAERWRLAREVGMALETRRRVESNLRLHLVPPFGPHLVRAITVTSVMEWLTKMVRNDLPKASIRLYFDLLKTVLNAAKADKVIVDNPTNGVEVGQCCAACPATPKWVPTGRAGREAAQRGA